MLAYAICRGWRDVRAATLQEINRLQASEARTAPTRILNSLIYASDERRPAAVVIARRAGV